MAMAALLTELLMEEHGGKSTMDFIRSYAESYAIGRNMPQHLAEDAVSEALLKLSTRLGEYDRTRAAFSTWAIGIVKNELRNMARKDARRNSMLALSIDEEDHGDNARPALVIESIVGDEFGIDNIIDSEQRTEDNRAMAALANNIFGDYDAVVDGRVVKRSLLLACVDAYATVGHHGWAAAASRMTGVSEQVISNKRSMARIMWERREEKMRSGTSQPGGSIS